MLITNMGEILKKEPKIPMKTLLGKLGITKKSRGSNLGLLITHWKTKHYNKT